MNEGRYFPALVSIGNKLFVISEYNTSSSEVFDSYSRKFTYLQSTYSNPLRLSVIQAVSIGFNIVVFSIKVSKTRSYIYDVINNHWSHLDIGVIENLTFFSCVKYLTF